MNIYENNKQLLTAMGGDSANLATDFEVRKAILDLLGGDSSNCNSIYEVDKQILNIYLEGGGGTGGDCDLTPITITENGVYSREIGGYSEVTVNVEIPECPEIPLTAITINSNGTYIPEEGGYNEVIVDVAGGGAGGEGGKVKVRSLSFDNNCVDENGTINVNLIDTSNVTDMSYLFSGCNSLQSLDLSGWDTSNVTSMSNMFKGCNSLQSLDLSGFVTNNTTNINSLFFSFQSNSLQSLDLSGWDTSNVTSMASLFFSFQSNSLQSLDLSGWDTSNVTNMKTIFDNTRIDIVDITGWKANNVTNITYFCTNNTVIKSYVGGKTIEDVIENNLCILIGLKISLTFLGSYTERPSLRALINGLADLTGSTSQTLSLGSTLKAKLTEEDIAVATAKNWTIA